ncbi:hypothetical protein BD779DRAFT_1516098 [Infundibulicybe gibba]|nr:hypothetical protein BD779DRAFT_1516098 [Infundibulicybe gibba]
MPFEPPYPPYDPTERGWPYQTLVKRWPIIVTGVIDHLYSACHELSLQSQDTNSTRNDPDRKALEATISEGRRIIEKISKLKYHMGRDHPLDPIPQDGGFHVDIYNTQLESLANDSKGTWFTAPWLFAECYLYRLLRSFFAETEYWSNHDPFLPQKMSTFQQSKASIYQIATMMMELDAGGVERTLSPQQTDILAKEMIQLCLWGNATDLSLLTHLSAGDIASLQSLGRDAQAARERYILMNDQVAVWKHIKSLDGARIDFVLDNAGFELFTDLVFADFLVTYTPHVSRVVFHPKLIPWFVSDVTPFDFDQTLSSLLDPTFFRSNDEAHQDEPASMNLVHLVTRWKRYVDDGTFALSVPIGTPLHGKEVTSQLAHFWTTPFPYWDMHIHAKELYDHLKDSGLVIFKGDLK